MKIAMIGPGAMGLLFGGKLAACADVSLIGNNEVNIREICTVAAGEGFCSEKTCFSYTVDKQELVSYI